MTNFIMGATMRLRDDFTDVARRIMRATDSLTRSTQDAQRGSQNYRDANGRLRNSMNQFTSDSNAAQRSTILANGAYKQQTSILGRVRDGMFGIGGAVGAIATGIAVKKGFDWLITSNADMETYLNTLTVVMKSSEKAQKTLDWANTFSAKTPFEIPEVIEATTRLTSYGIEAEKVLGITGDMASVMGKDLMQAVEAVADAQTGELERLKEFGITKGMIEKAANKMGSKPINKKGQITDEKAFNAALFSLMEERFKGGMELQSKTYKGMVSNAADFMGTLGRKLGKPLFEKTKEGLAKFLVFLEKLDQSGAVDRFVAKTTIFGGKVAAVFRWITSTVGAQVAIISGKVKGFLTEHQPQITQLGKRFSEAFQAVSDYATPIITWLWETGIPGLVDGLATAADWVLDIATFFTENWSHIRPFIEGIVTSVLGFGLAAYGIIGVIKLVTAAQWLWSAAMSANPIGLVIVGIGLLLGAGIWLAENWRMLIAKAGEWLGSIGWLQTALAWVSVKISELIAWGVNLWENWKTLAKNGDVLIAGVKTVWTGMTTFISGKMDEAKTWGKNIITTMASGVLAAKDKIVNAFTSVFKKVRDLMPFSDAKKGPFSQLTYSGGAVMTTLAAGVQKKAGMFQSSVSKAFSGTSLGSDSNVTGSVVGSGSRNTHVNAAGASRTAVGGSKTTIGTLIGSLTIADAGSKDTKTMVDEIIDELHARFTQADEVLGTSDKGALLL